jgi:hypothetical protein
MSHLPSPPVRLRSRNSLLSSSIQGHSVPLVATVHCLSLPVHPSTAKQERRPQCWGGSIQSCHHLPLPLPLLCRARRSQTHTQMMRLEAGRRPGLALETTAQNWAPLSSGWLRSKGIKRSWPVLPPHAISTPIGCGGALLARVGLQGWPGTCFSHKCEQLAFLVENPGLERVILQLL